MWRAAARELFDWRFNCHWAFSLSAASSGACVSLVRRVWRKMATLSWPCFRSLRLILRSPRSGRLEGWTRRHGSSCVADATLLTMRSGEVLYSDLILRNCAAFIQTSSQPAKFRPHPEEPAKRASRRMATRITLPPIQFSNSRRKPTLRRPCSLRRGVRRPLFPPGACAEGMERRVAHQQVRAWGAVCVPG